MQVSQLVKKMEEESKGGIESATRKQLRNKIASLSQPQVKRAKDALAMIWNYMKGPLEPPATVYTFAFSVTPTLFPNWQRPLFTSSIVIEEWGPAITTRK
ncbi:hypothetical protein BDM02DRAFT_1690125 [Thelephora ganbajun]|uniref:Uncharacterized protein n=1 Tax=Thelephora ganbajun TaxID=370292 RepID=A0ACB6ZKC6_THEGA|nr:hypothetical protein BDM02DRAFT_1690125 [Thelephora ganbajun]